MLSRLSSSLPLIILPLLAVAGGAWAASPSPAAVQGRHLFVGEVPLRGLIVGHATALPLQASRCVNCHAEANAVPPAAAKASSTAGFAPVLTARELTQPVARRGGPPSRYDPASFCHLLRTGIDPAYVIIPRAMPRYELSDADCQSLWAYLIETGKP